MKLFSTCRSIFEQWIRGIADAPKNLIAPDRDPNELHTEAPLTGPRGAFTSHWIVAPTTTVVPSMKIPTRLPRLTLASLLTLGLCSCPSLGEALEDKVFVFGTFTLGHHHPTVDAEGFFDELLGEEIEFVFVLDYPTYGSHETDHTGLPIEKKTTLYLGGQEAYFTSESQLALLELLEEALSGGGLMVLRRELKSEDKGLHFMSDHEGNHGDHFYSIRITAWGAERFHYYDEDEINPIEYPPLAAGRAEPGSISLGRISHEPWEWTDLLLGDVEIVRVVPFKSTGTETMFFEY